MGNSFSPERWTRFLEDQAPGLTWLAATLLEWAELPPAARRAWQVTVQESRTGEVASLAALHETSGMLAVASLPDVPPPFLAEAERVTRLVGGPESLQVVFEANPVLAERRTPARVRQVFTYDADAPTPHMNLQRAPEGMWEDLERFRAASEGALDPLTPADLMGPTQQGHVWIVVEDGDIAGMFRIEGVARRRVFVTDLCVHPAARGLGIGTALLRSAAHVVRVEYARGSVLAVPATPAAERTALAAGFTDRGVVEDVVLA